MTPIKLTEREGAFNKLALDTMREFQIMIEAYNDKVGSDDTLVAAVLVGLSLAARGVELTMVEA